MPRRSSSCGRRARPPALNAWFRGGARRGGRLRVAPRLGCPGPRRNRRLDRRGARLLRRGDRLETLGCHFVDYAREVLDLGKSTAESLARLGGALRTRPLLREALRSGKVGLRAAETVWKVAVGEAEAEWVERAATAHGPRARGRGPPRRVPTRPSPTPTVAAARRPPAPRRARGRGRGARPRPADGPGGEPARGVGGALAGVPRRVPGRPRRGRRAPAPRDASGDRTAPASDSSLAQGGPRGGDAALVPAPGRRRLARPGGPVLRERHGGGRRRAAARARQAARRLGRGHRLLRARPQEQRRPRAPRVHELPRTTARSGSRLPARAIEQRAALEERIWASPALQEARRQKLSFEKLRLLARLPERDIASWTPRAHALTCIALKRKLEGERERQMRASRKLSVSRAAPHRRGPGGGVPGRPEAGRGPHLGREAASPSWRATS